MGRWVALLRATSCPALSVCVGWLGSEGSSWVPSTTRTSTPLGSLRSTVTPPMLCGSLLTFAPVASASRSTSVASAARNAAPRYVDRGPRRTITQGAPLSVPRSCSSSAVRLTVVKPNAWANRSEPARSGFWNSSQARSRNLDRRVGRAAGVLAAERSLFAVQIAVRPVMGWSSAVPLCLD